MKPEPLLLVSPEPDGLLPVFAGGLLFGLVLATMVVIVGCAMGKRDRRLREKGMRPETRNERIPRIAREAIKERFGKEIDDLPQEVINAIRGAVLDAEGAGPEVMKFAAIAEYRYRAELAAWTGPAGEEE